MTVDLDQPTKQVISPEAFVHVVLKTKKYHAMIDFYKKFLGAHVAYGNEFISFLAYDEEHHRLGIAKIPGTQDRNPKASGLDHLAFSFKTLEDLTLAYQQREELGITPVWCVNHGPATSMYYRDPDGNKIETQVDNFDSPEAATKFMMSKEFQENPIGTDFDPQDLIRRLKSGEDICSIKKRIESGSRGVPEHLET